MNEVFTIDREFLFKSTIHEITSISIEHNYDINGSNLEGEFIISGDYRLHEISINKEDFSFKIPFTHEIRSNVNLDTIDIEITDFSYDFDNGDELTVHVEYLVKGDEAVLEFSDENKLNEFLDNNKAVEVVNLLEKVKAETPKEEEKTVDDKVNDAPKENTNDRNQNDDKKIDENMILNSINEEEEYIKYHVHTVTMNDTIESITSMYKISLNTLKKYNSFENLELNMKLIIPENEEL
jgi:LysM repeat protein